jgi:hypothetical protein
MQTHSGRLRAARAVAAAVAVLSCAPASVHAARVGILSNAFFNETAAEFNATLAGHTFTAVDVGGTVPSLATLTSSFDVLLVFEDTTFANATTVGNRAAAFAQTGRPVVLGTFYDQDRSDSSPELAPHGWGALETIDPNTTDGKGTGYAPRTLNTGTMLTHPLTQGVGSLSAAKFAGGNQAKPGTTVAAYWQQPNARGQPDPAIAYRVTGPACVIHVAIAPNYPAVGTAGVDFAGDFHRVWRNAFDFAAGGCVAAAALPGAHAIPALSDAALALTALLLAALGMRGLRRRPR